MPFALLWAMNIFTTSAPDINIDQFMTNRPAPSTYNNDKRENSGFARHVHDAERSLKRPAGKTEEYSKNQNELMSRPEPKKTNESNTVKTEGRQETEDTKKGQQISNAEHGKDEIGHEGNVSDIKAEKKPEEELEHADFEDNDINGDKVLNTDITEKGIAPSGPIPVMHSSSQQMSVNPSLFTSLTSHVLSLSLNIIVSYYYNKYESALMLMFYLVRNPGLSLLFHLISFFRLLKCRTQKQCKS